MQLLQVLRTKMGNCSANNSVLKVFDRPFERKKKKVTTDLFWAESRNALNQPCLSSRPLPHMELAIHTDQYVAILDKMLRLTFFRCVSLYLASLDIPDANNTQTNTILIKLASFKRMAIGHLCNIVKGLYVPPFRNQPKLTLLELNSLMPRDESPLVS